MQDPPQQIPEGYRQRIEQHVSTIVPEAEKLMDVAGEFLAETITVGSDKVIITIINRKSNANIQDDQ